MRNLTERLFRALYQVSHLVIKMNCVVRISLILCLIRHSFTYSYEDFVNLKRTLFENYTNDVRPVLNQSEPIHVFIDMWISSIQSFDEKHGILRTSLGFGIMWNDEILRWNASETGHDYLNFPKQDVWYPKMHLRNSATENMFLRFTDDEDQLTVHFANGQAYLLESGLTTTIAMLIFSDSHLINIAVPLNL